MGFDDVLKGVACILLDGFSMQAKHNSRNRNFTDEQRAEFAAASENMKDYSRRIRSNRHNDYDDDDDY